LISPLAIPATAFGKSLFSRSWRAAPLYGAMLHTTGSGILDKSATKTADDTLRQAVNYYAGTGGPHYVIGWDGRIVAIVADERMRGAHAAVDEAEQRAYADGSWRQKVSPKGLALWTNLWPGRPSPAALSPTGRLNQVNDLWIGIEMIPITYDGRGYYADPAYPGARFTQAQHEAARRLVDDIGQRHGFPSGWKNTPRLVGHSDLNPIERDSPQLPLWDPGYANGSFNMNHVRGSGARTLLLIGAALAGLGAVYVATRPRSPASLR